MDSDWCLFCEKHVQDLGALYCSKECARKDKLMAVTSKPSSFSSSSPPSSTSSSPTLTPSTNSLSLKRPSRLTMTVTYPCMFRSSTLVPASISSRGGIRKDTFSPFPAMTATSIRCLPLSRSGVRRQPLALDG
ncbi:hypothetical protein EDD21DRAFT_412187 [Dissophora ornata]|nr:hypothetical protein EDD21DRAFT_412187 [Dissophora ornata]